MKRIFPFLVFMITLLVWSGAASAQESTAEATTEATAEAAAETTEAAEVESTPEVTPAAPLPPGALLDFPGPGAYTVQVMQGTVARSYGVFIPESYAELDAPAPLVIVLHAANGTGTLAEQHTGFDQIAEENGFVVAYPDGVNGYWNDGRDLDPRVDMTISDSAYVAGLISFLGTKLSIDPARVYLTGYSMGGMMAIRAGCELSDRIAGVASVASTMPEYATPFCENSAALPILFLIGTDDHSVPWTGQERSGTGYMSAINSLTYWREHNRCADDLTQEVLADGDLQDGTRVIVNRSSICDGSSEVVLYGIYFGGHTWPGRPNPMGFDPGLVSYDIDGTRVIWTFFSQHVRGE